MKLLWIFGLLGILTPALISPRGSSEWYLTSRSLHPPVISPCLSSRFVSQCFLLSQGKIAWLSIWFLLSECMVIYLSLTHNFIWSIFYNLSGYFPLKNTAKSIEISHWIVGVLFSLYSFWWSISIFVWCELKAGVQLKGVNSSTIEKEDRTKVLGTVKKVNLSSCFARRKSRLYRVTGHLWQQF